MAMATRIHSTRSNRRGRLGSAPLIAAAIVVVGFAVLVAASVSPPDRSVFDASLPNPMVGMARTAPGEVSGEVQLAGLEIAGVEVAMGDLALGVTYVPLLQLRLDERPVDIDELITPADHGELLAVLERSVVASGP
jgi:hypothetical protein